MQYKTGSSAPDFIYEETYPDTEKVPFDADNGKQAAIVEAFKVRGNPSSDLLPCLSSRCI